MKKLKCIIMVLLLMACNLATISASNDLWMCNETGYSSLKDAVGSTSGDRTFVLNEDRNMADEVISLHDSEITIDLNGFDYEMDTIYAEGANIKIINNGTDISAFTIDSIIINSGTVEIGANVFVIFGNRIYINNTEHDRKLIIGKDSKVACANSTWGGIQVSNFTQSNTEIVIDGELNRSSCNVSVIGDVKVAIGDNARINNNKIEFGATVYNQLDNASEYFYDIEISDYDLLSDLNLKVYRGSYNFNPGGFIDNDLYKVICSDNIYKIVSKNDYTCQAVYGEEGLEISFYGSDAENAVDLLVRGQIDNTYSDSTYETENRNSYLSLSLKNASFDGYGNIKNYKKYLDSVLQQEESYIKKKDSITINISVEDLQSMGYIDGRYNIEVCADGSYSKTNCVINTGISSDSINLKELPESMYITSKEDLKIYEFKKSDIVPDDFVAQADNSEVEISDISWYYKEENGEFQYANVFYSDEYYYIGFEFKFLNSDQNKTDISKYTYNGRNCEKIYEFGGTELNNKIEYGTTYEAIFPFGEVSTAAEATFDENGLTIRFNCEDAEKIVDDLVYGEVYQYPNDDDYIQQNSKLRLSLIDSEYSSYIELYNYKFIEYGEIRENIHRIDKLDDTTIRISMENLFLSKIVDGKYNIECYTETDSYRFECEILTGKSFDDYGLKDKPHKVNISLPEDFGYYAGMFVNNRSQILNIVDENGDQIERYKVSWAEKSEDGYFSYPSCLEDGKEYYLIVGIKGLAREYDYALEAEYNGDLYSEYSLGHYPFDGRCVAVYENYYEIAINMGQPDKFFNVNFNKNDGLVFDFKSRNGNEIARKAIEGYICDYSGNDNNSESVPYLNMYYEDNNCYGDMLVRNEKYYYNGKLEEEKVFFEEVSENENAVRISIEKLLEMDVVDGRYRIVLNYENQEYESFIDIYTGKKLEDLEIRELPDSVSVVVNKDILLYEGMDTEDVAVDLSINDNNGNAINNFDYEIYGKHDESKIYGTISKDYEYFLAIEIPFLDRDYSHDFTIYMNGIESSYEVFGQWTDTGKMSYSRIYVITYPIGNAISYPVNVIFDKDTGLIAEFNTEDAEDIVNSIIKGYGIAKDDKQFNYMYLRYKGDMFTGNATLVNGEGRDENGVTVFTPFVKRSNKSVVVPLSELQKYGFMDGEYEIYLSNTNNFGIDVKICDSVNIITGIKEDLTLVPVDELHIRIDEKYLNPIVGDKIEEMGAIPFEATDENGMPVENCTVSWAKICSYKYNAGWDDSESFVIADKDIFGLDDGAFIWKDTPSFDSQNTYYLYVNYPVPMAEYGKDMKLYINDKEYDVNGGHAITEYIDDGTFELCWFDLSYTDKYSSVVEIGHASSKYNKPDEISGKTVADKINEIFIVSEETGGGIAYVDDVNTSSSNETIMSVLGDNGRIEITLRNATVENVSQNDEVLPLITKISFDVTPINSYGTKLHGDIGDKVVFRLPVDGASNFAYASVYHEGTYVGTYEIRSDENGNKYIEVESDSFSVFDVYYAYEAKKIIMGDVNTDGELSGKDRILLRNYLVKKIKSDSINLSAADVNLDSKVDSLDRVYLRNLITGKIKQ